MAGPRVKTSLSAGPSSTGASTPVGKAPLVLGALAYVTAFLLPLTLLLEHHRVVGVLGFCLSAFFAPFAPISWIVGERTERLGGEADRWKGRTGRRLGQGGTLILVAELTLILLLIATLRLSGSFPASFWAAR